MVVIKETDWYKVRKNIECEKKEQQVLSNKCIYNNKFYQGVMKVFNKL